MKQRRQKTIIRAKCPCGGICRIAVVQTEDARETVTELPTYVKCPKCGKSISSEKSPEFRKYRELREKKLGKL